MDVDAVLARSGTVPGRHDHHSIGAAIETRIVSEVTPSLAPPGITLAVGDLFGALTGMLRCRGRTASDRFDAMKPLPQTRMSVDEYLAWSEANPGRYELVQGEVYAMTPERVLHAEVKAAAYVALRRSIRAAALPCRAMPDGMTVRIDTRTAYEPDALVYCGPRRDPNSVEVPNPIIVVEVSSPSTRRTDASEKLAGYFQVPSIHHYMMIDPDRRMVIHHHRVGNEVETAFLQEGTLVLDPPGLELPIAFLFEEP